MADGAYACSACGLSLAESLRTAAGHAEDVEATIARQARYGAGSRGGSDEPLPVDLTAAAKLHPIQTAISGWARIITEETRRRPRWRPYLGPTCPPARPGDHQRAGNRCDHDSCSTARRRERPTTLAVDTAWLAQRRQIGWLRKHPAADEAFRDLTDACAQLARLVDRPPDRDLVGMCDCGRVLYAARGKTVVTCPETTCRLRWDVADSRETLRRALDGRLVTAAEAARLASYLDTDRNQTQIRKLVNAWSARALIVPHGQVDGEYAYRFGDIADRLARTPRRQREGAAA